jgi:uncharacterized protein YciI
VAQFIVIARDGTDPGAAARRHAARPAHVERIKPAVETLALKAAIGILDESGNTVGGVLVTEFASREELAAWLAEDPYTKSGVWQQFEIHPARVAVWDGKSV